MVNGWFPKWSPDGQHILSGHGTAWLTRVADGLAVSLGQGFAGGWLDATQYVYLTDAGDVVRGEIGREPAPSNRGPFNAVAVGGGRWLGWRAPAHLECDLAGVLDTDGFAPALGPNGRYAYLRHPASETQQLVVEGRPDLHVRGALAQPALSLTAVAWTQFSSTYNRSPWVAVDEMPPRNCHATWEPWEFAPVLVETPQAFPRAAECSGGPSAPARVVWVLSHDNTRLMLRPFTDTTGIVVEVGVTDNPAVVWAGDVFRVAWSREGRLMVRDVNPVTAEWVDLRISREVS